MVAPGWILGERHAHDPQQLKDDCFASIPARRWGVPQDIAGAVLYLASDEGPRSQGCEMLAELAY